MLSVVAASVVLVLGYTLVPLAGMLIVVCVDDRARLLSKYWACMISQYGGFVLEMAPFAWLIQWSADRFGFAAWPAWIAFAWIAFTSFNTLFQFDVMCAGNRSGAWAPKDP